jgi:hypothetical protein
MIAVVGFIVVAGIGVLLLSLADLLPVRYWWRATPALLLTAAVLLLADRNWSVVTLGPSSFELKSILTNSPIREFILFVLLLTGMIARVVSLAIERRETNGVVTPATSLNIDRWQFVYPMLFAVPTFGALLSQLPTPNLSIADSVLAFQTGFFWQTILKKSEANVRV